MSDSPPKPKRSANARAVCYEPLPDGYKALILRGGRRHRQRSRAAYEEALHEVDAHASYRIERALILDLLGNDAKVEASRQFYHRAHHRLIYRIRREVADEGPVDLQVVHRQILQGGERAHAAAEIVQREFAAQAVQYGNEAAHVVQVGEHRALGHLEANIGGIRPGVIETVDDELQEFQVSEGLAGDIDRDAALLRQAQAASAERGQHRLHHPAIHEGHQAIAFGRADEIDRRNARLADFGFQAHEHFERRAVHAVAARVYDGLIVELEFIVAQGGL